MFIKMIIRVRFYVLQHWVKCETGYLLKDLVLPYANPEFLKQMIWKVMLIKRGNIIQNTFVYDFELYIFTKHINTSYMHFVSSLYDC